jgi:hypothetical protein
MAPMEYLGARGTLIHDENLISKISCQTPFKTYIFLLVRMGWMLMVSALLFSFYTSGVYLRRKNSSAFFKTVEFKTCKIHNFISREICKYDPLQRVWA